MIFDTTNNVEDTKLNANDIKDSTRQKKVKDTKQTKVMQQNETDRKKTGDENYFKRYKTLQNKRHLIFYDVVLILGGFHIIVFNTETRMLCLTVHVN